MTDTLFDVETTDTTVPAPLVRRGRPAATAVGALNVAAGPLPERPTVVEPAPVLTVVVYGTPAPQGSKKIGRSHVGKPIVLDDNQATAPWREKVGWAARQAMAESGMTQPLDGPLRVEVTFTLPKPASAPKRRRTWAATKPDIDKLQRSTFDALTDIGVWREDSRLQKVSAEKVYPGEPGEHGWALHVPGARIRVWCVPEAWPAIDAHAYAVLLLVDRHRAEYTQLLAMVGEQEAAA